MVDTTRTEKIVAQAKNNIDKGKYEYVMHRKPKPPVRAHVRYSHSANRH